MMRIYTVHGGESGLPVSYIVFMQKFEALRHRLLPNKMKIGISREILRTSSTCNANSQNSPRKRNGRRWNVRRKGITRSASSSVSGSMITSKMGTMWFLVSLFSQEERYVAIPISSVLVGTRLRTTFWPSLMRTASKRRYP